MQHLRTQRQEDEGCTSEYDEKQELPELLSTSAECTLIDSCTCAQNSRSSSCWQNKRLKNLVKCREYVENLPLYAICLTRLRPLLQNSVDRILKQECSPAKMRQLLLSAAGGVSECCEGANKIKGSHPEFTNLPSVLCCTSRYCQISSQVQRIC